jgi:hypothetical protein
MERSALHRKLKTLNIHAANGKLNGIDNEMIDDMEVLEEIAN